MKRTRGGRRTPVEKDLSLPVLQRGPEVLRALAANDVVVLVSETGSGKTTQVPQLILDADPSASVIITQPRRVAAITVAHRVAAERAVDVGDEVGYAVRFEDKSQRGVTRIRYVTDGVLLREALSDGRSGLKNRYSHIIIDEVHERSVNTDILMGVIKETLTASSAPVGVNQSPKSKFGPLQLIRSCLPVKVVIMSATTDAEKIAKFFRKGTSLSVDVLQISGRSHPVKTMLAVQPVSDYVDGAAISALQVHTGHPLPGDILVFLPGQEDIEAAIACFKRSARAEISKQGRSRIVVVPLYASQSPADQMRAIQPLPEETRATHRKVIFATNIAETSITIPGVKYVVDSGMVKVRSLVKHRGVYTDILKVQPVSQAQAEQRRGRAGRTGPGFLFRLYTQNDFDKLEKFPKPEILRVDATTSMLQIIVLKHFSQKSTRLGDGRQSPPQRSSPFTFPMIDRIPRASVERALESLFTLGAVDRDMILTRAGELMSRIPTSPMIARSLLEALRVGCADSMLSLAAVLSVDGDIFLRPSTKMDQAKAAHRRFLSPRGDHLTMVNAFQAFHALGSPARKTEFCRDHFLNHRTLTSAVSIRAQLNNILQHGDLVSWGLRNPLPAELSAAIEEDSMEDLVCRCLVAGFFRNVARRRAEDGKYISMANVTGAEGPESGVDVHPSSTLRSLKRNAQPPLVIYNELLWTSKLYMRTVSVVEQEWLPMHSGRFFRVKEQRL